MTLPTGSALAEWLDHIATDLREGHAANTQMAKGLSAIRGVVLNAKDDRKALRIINKIVGEALYGDFPGTIERINRRWP